MAKKETIVCTTYKRGAVVRMEASNRIGIPLSKKKVYIVFRIEVNYNGEINKVFDTVFSSEEKALNYIHKMMLCGSPYLYETEECEVE
jgi:hypothetical protein